MKAVLASLGFGIGPCATGCQGRADQMNAWGVDGCMANIDTIVGWRKEEAERVGWWEKAKAAMTVATGAAGFVPNPRDPYRSIAMEAIRRTKLD